MIEISGFGIVLLFLIGGIAFLVVTLLLGRILRPNKPTPEKLITYESGEDPTGTAWGQFNVRFYVVALVFLLFEAELVFLFPWASVFGDEQLIQETGGLWARFSMVEAFIFIGILFVGLVYVWAKGMLQWVRPRPKSPDYQSGIPEEVYDKFK